MLLLRPQAYMLVVIRCDTLYCYIHSAYNCLFSNLHKLKTPLDTALMLTAEVSKLKPATFMGRHTCLLV